jgi:hypothetical protein
MFVFEYWEAPRGPGGQVTDDAVFGGIADENAWEHRFKKPFAVVSAADRKLALWNLQVEAERNAHETASKAAAAAGKSALEPYEEPEPPSDIYLPTEWVTFLAWCRLRRRPELAIPDDYDKWAATVKGWYYQSEEEAAADAEQAEVDETGSRLDPTDQAAPPTKPPSSSSSAASTGPAS